MPPLPLGPGPITLPGPLLLGIPPAVALAVVATAPPPVAAIGPPRALTLTLTAPNGATDFPDAAFPFAPTLALAPTAAAAAAAAATPFPSLPPAKPAKPVEEELWRVVDVPLPFDAVTSTPPLVADCLLCLFLALVLLTT